MCGSVYCAVDKAGAPINFLLTAKPDRKVVPRFLCKAAGRHGVPQKVIIDNSDANTAAIENYNAVHDAEIEIEIRPVKFFNNIVEQGHRTIKRMTKPCGK